MGVSTRERRPAMWPWLVMPLIVLVAFYALYRVHQRPGNAPPPTQTTSATSTGGG
jgi:hypothetical protein